MSHALLPESIKSTRVQIQQMRTLLDTYFYSVLYYNSVVWLLPEIGPAMKQNLLSISACALRLCDKSNNCELSFIKLHERQKKCTPTQIMTYQSALQLHKVINFEKPNFEAVTVLNQIICTRRQTVFLIFKECSSKIGMNTTANKFYQLTGKISLCTLGYSFVHYKKMMKIQFLKFGKT